MAGLLLLVCFGDLEVCFIIFNDISPTIEHIYHPCDVAFGRVVWLIALGECR